jgi:hypothetical protein
MRFVTIAKAIVQFLLANKELLGAITATATATGLLFKGWPQLVNRWREKRRRYSLAQKINAEDYTLQDIERAVTFYIDPDCQVVDPGGAEDFRHVYPVRQNLFEVVDDLLNKQTVNKFSLLLADTGMGKTSFLLNYYARHWQNARQRERFSIRLIPLGASDADDKISDVANKPDTVLFLDALEEDTLAIGASKKRFRDLVQASSRFRHVLITCRTQFFAQDDEIPKEAGIIKVGPIGPGDTREYSINKLYLSPFSEEQITRYLWRRFPFWQPRKRRNALAVVRKIADLPARPMLLAQIELILSLGEECKYSFQIYEQMIQSWLSREKGIAEPVALREFCECLAVDIFENRETRGAEKIAEPELPSLAATFGIALPRVEHIRTRSLLNRDAQGNLKFSHRSILEYLFIARFRKFPSTTPRMDWTDQMKQFYWETSLDAWEKYRVPEPFQREADLTGLEHLKLRPIVVLRSVPIVMTEKDANEFRRLSQEKSARVERAPHFYRGIEGSSVNSGEASSAIERFYVELARNIEISQVVGSPALQKKVNSLAACFSTGRAMIVVDHALGLAWELGDDGPTQFELAVPRAKILSTLKFGGFTTWRLPTLEEVFSLAHLSRCEEYKPLLSGLGSRVWTADRLGIQLLSVDIKTSVLQLEGFSNPLGDWPRAVCVTSTSSGPPV